MNAVKVYCEASEREWNYGVFAEILEDFFDFDLKDLIRFGFSDEALRYCYSSARIELTKLELISDKN